MPQTLNTKSYQKGAQTILRYLKMHRREVLILALLSLVSAVGNAVVPYLLGRLFDAVLGAGAPFMFAGYALSPFVAILGAWLFAMLVSDIAERFKNVRREMLSASLEADYTAFGFAKLLRFPLGFHKQRKMGEIVERIRRGSGWLEVIINRILIDLAPQFFSIALALVIVFMMNATLAALLLGAVILYAVILVRVAPRLSVFSRKMQSAYSRAYGDAHDTVANVSAVKQAGAEEYERRKLIRNFRGRAARFWVEYIRVGTNLNFIQRIIVTLTQLVLFAVSIYFIRHGSMTVGELIAFNGYAAMLFGPFVILGRNWDLIQNGLIAIERSEKILSHAEEPYNPDGAVIIPDMRGEVEFERVGFRYGKKQNTVLDAVSFRVEAGQSVALVGESGVGKTTLVDLISLYHRPTSGRILVDGHDITMIDLRLLRGAIAVVPQEILLFNDTVKNNIRYGRFGATDKDVADAARKAHADEFIERFPAGYNQVVGERGIKLSTGQKQRIAISRAILRNPRILILDEPTSALDAKTEQYIAESLRELMRGRTTFIIAHRLSTVRNADRILVLQQGRIVEEGSHAELMKKREGAYRKLYELQVGFV